MKLTFTFEEDDLRKMIGEYFERNGFKAKDLENLIDKFNQIYPEGIKVDADPLPTLTETTESHDSNEVVGPGYLPEESLETPTEDQTEEIFEEIEKEGPEFRMGLTDLLDPEKKLPDDQSTRRQEIENILKEGEKYKNV